MVSRPGPPRGVRASTPSYPSRAPEQVEVPTVLAFRSESGPHLRASSLATVHHSLSRVARVRADVGSDRGEPIRNTK